MSKRFVVWSVILAASGVCFSMPSIGEPTPSVMPEIGYDADFSANYMPMLQIAYEDFRAVRRDISCFNVMMRKTETETLIMFTPPLDFGDGENGTLTIPVSPGQSPCGRGIEYHFDSQGSLVRRVNQR
jgi:hypothetical protein